MDRATMRIAPILDSRWRHALPTEIESSFVYEIQHRPEIRTSMNCVVHKPAQRFILTIDPRSVYLPFSRSWITWAFSRRKHHANTNLAVLSGSDSQDSVLNFVIGTDQDAFIFSSHFKSFTNFLKSISQRVNVLGKRPFCPAHLKETLISWQSEFSTQICNSPIRHLRESLLRTIAPSIAFLDVHAVQQIKEQFLLSFPLFQDVEPQGYVLQRCCEVTENLNSYRPTLVLICSKALKECDRSYSTVECPNSQ